VVSALQLRVQATGRRDSGQSIDSKLIAESCMGRIFPLLGGEKYGRKDEFWL